MITYLVAALKADVTLASLVSTRIWSNVLPQGSTLPAITFQQVSRTPVHHRSGPNAIVTTRLQFGVNGRSYTTVREVVDALVDALQAFTRSTAPRVSRVFVDSVSDDVQPGFDTGDYFRTLVFANIQHEES